MPFTMTTSREHNLRIITQLGRVSDIEFLQFYRTLFDVPDFDSAMDVLVDLRDADSSERGVAALREVAGLVKREFDKGEAETRIAVVAPQQLSFGLARMHEAFAEPGAWEFSVFRTMDRALDWLGLPSDLLHESNLAN